jgi:hypothetical protein
MIMREVCQWCLLDTYGTITIREATRAASTGAAATRAAIQEAAPPAKRLKPSVCASRASARYAVVSKRRDRCLSGSSPLESPEKVRGMEEFNDSFIIELEDDELQREEMEEKEMKEMEMKEKEMEKEREEDVEVEQREEEGELPFRVPKPP